MKRIVLATAFIALPLFAGINYNSSKSNSGNFTITCDNAACTAAHVADVNKWLAETGQPAGKRAHTPLADVRSVSLAKDGTLTCMQNSGAPCTSDQGKALAEGYKPTAAWKEPAPATRSNIKNN